MAFGSVACSRRCKWLWLAQWQKLTPWNSCKLSHNSFDYLKTNIRSACAKQSAVTARASEWEREALIWSTLVTQWSNLAGSSRHQYTAEITGVCEASCHLPWPKVYHTLFSFISFGLWEQNCAFCWWFVFDLTHKSFDKKKVDGSPEGEGQRSTYGKGIE